MRKLLSILLCLVLSAALLLPAWAAASGSFLFRDYDVADQSVYCYGKQLPSGGTLTVSCGPNETEDASFSTIRAAKVPVTVYCLVDSGTSVSKAVQQQQKDVLQTINTLMGSEDSMVLATIDKTFFESEPLTDSTSRANAIDGISRGNWSTYLYAGIDQALESVCTNTSYHTNRFLLILSDGHSDGKDGVKTDAIQEKISTARIPVYTLILGTPSTNRTQGELTTLKQFSEASIGGSFVNLSADKVSAVNAADSFWDNVQNSSVISVSAASLPADKDAELLIRYETGNIRYEDTILIRAVDLARAVPSTEPPSEDTVETTEPGPEGPGEDGEIPWLLVGIAAAVFVAVVAVAAIVLLRRKKPVPQQDENTDSTETDVTPTNNDWISDIEHFPGSEALNPDNLGPTMPVTGDCHVFMVAIMHPDVTQDFWLTEGAEQTIGRDSSATIVLNSNDKNLSRIHAFILWDGTHLLVQDKHSTCGTYVNGVRCAEDAWYLVENSATIRAGAYDYRVTYEVKGET